MSTNITLKEGFDAFLEYSKALIARVDGDSSEAGWVNGGDGEDNASTPLNAHNLNKMHYAILAIRNAIVNHSSSDRNEHFIDGKYHFTINGKDIIFDESNDVMSVIEQVSDALLGKSTDGLSSTLNGLVGYIRSMDYTYATQQDNTANHTGLIYNVTQNDGKISTTRRQLVVQQIGSDSNLLIKNPASFTDASDIFISNEQEVNARKNFAASILEDAYTEDTTDYGDDYISDNEMDKKIVSRAANLKNLTDENSTSTDTVHFSIGDKEYEHQITRVDESIMSDESLINSIKGKFATKSVGNISGSNASPVQITDTTVQSLLENILGIVDAVIPNGFKLSSPSSINANGESATVNVSWTVSNGTYADASYTVTVSQNSSTLFYDEGSSNNGSVGITVSIPTDANSVTVKGECLFDGASVNDSSSTIKINREVVFGITESEGYAPEESTVFKHSSDLTKGISHSYELVNQCAILKYPKYWGELTSIVDQNGFENLSSFNKSSDGSLYIYTMAVPTTNSMTFTFIK